MDAAPEHSSCWQSKRAWCLQLLALIECGRLQPAALTEEATEGDPGLRRAPGSGPMPDEVALMWRIFCTWLQVRKTLQASLGEES